MAKLKHKRIRPEKGHGARGWSRWVHPTMTGYLLACCDCGLIHEMQFKAGARGPERANGTYRWADLPRPKYGVKFRARRAEQYTAREREKMVKAGLLAPPLSS